MFLENSLDLAHCIRYKCSDFIDLCRGPHLPHTGKLRSFYIHNSSSAIWPHGGQELQRVYGITFPEKEMMEKWKEQQEEALKRDHRIVGKAQHLFMTDPLSPGIVYRHVIILSRVFHEFYFSFRSVVSTSRGIFMERSFHFVETMHLHCLNKME